MRILSCICGLVLVSCASGPGERERVRFGVAGGYRFGGVEGDRRGEFSAIRLDENEQWGGFVEATSETGEALLAIRLTGSEAHHAVTSGGTGQAEFTQFQSLAMLGRRQELGAGFELRGLFGVGVGYARLDYDDALALSSREGISGSLAGAVELEVLDRAFGGVMGWYGVAGYPSDTECEFSSVMVYVGVRF